MIHAEDVLVLCQEKLPEVAWKIRHSGSGMSTFIRSCDMPLGSFALEDSHFPNRAWKVSAHNKIMGYAETPEDMERLLGVASKYLVGRARELTGMLQ